MSVYGKALGTYAKINRIKQATNKISEARLLGRKKQLQAERKANDAILNANIADAIGEAIVTGGSYAMSQSNSITPEMNENITTGASVLSEGISSAVGSAGSEAEAFMSREAFDYFRNQNNPDFVNAGLEGKQLSRSFEEIRKLRDFDRVSEELEDNEFGVSTDQMRNDLDKVEFIKGRGYNMGELPSISRERINNLYDQAGIGKIQNY